MGLSQLIVVAVLSIAHLAPLGGAAHIFFLETFAAWPSPVGTAYLATTFGGLLAVMAYFWRDLGEMAVGIVRASKGKRHPGARLATQLFTATIPVAAIVFAAPFVDVPLPTSTPALIGGATLGGGVLLLLLDRMSMTIKRLEHASYVDMIVVAFAQVAAFLVPGVGRSAITMTFARMLGYERADAARFSFLLALPALAGFVILQAWALWQDNALIWNAWLPVLAGVSFVAGLVTIAMMMAWLRRHSFTPFALYRIVMGATILILVWRM